MANINEDEGKNPQYEQLESWADSSGSEYPGNLGEKEDQQALEVESVWVVDQRAVGKDTDQVSRPENRSERRERGGPASWLANLTSVPPLQAAKPPRPSPRRQT